MLSPLTLGPNFSFSGIFEMWDPNLYGNQITYIQQGFPHPLDKHVAKLSPQEMVNKTHEALKPSYIIRDRYSHGVSRHANRGLAFTLVELLVALAIIVILAALILPTIKSAIERGKEAKCLGNIRSMTTIALAWIADRGYHALPSGYVNWNAELIPAYLPAELRCPSMPSSYDPDALGFRYAINSIALNYGSYVTAPVPPHRIVLTAEMYYMPDGWWSGWHLTSTSLGLSTGGVKQSHMGGLNLGFADGHAELVKAPTDPSGVINWWYPPAAAHNLKEGYYYDVTYWYYITNLHLTNW